MVTRFADAEVVKLTIPTRTPISRLPVWPDDEITRDWLEGIAAARGVATQSPERP
jgi:hypothetical protein